MLLALYTDRNRSSQGIKKLALLHAAELSEGMAVLEGMRRTLENLAERCHGAEPGRTILEDLETERS